MNSDMVFTSAQGYVYNGQVWDKITGSHRFGRFVPVKLFDQVPSAKAASTAKVPNIPGKRRGDMVGFSNGISSFISKQFNVASAGAVGGAKDTDMVVIGLTDEVSERQESDTALTNQQPVKCRSSRG